MDGFHAEANAALSSLRASLAAVAELDADDGGLEAGDEGPELPASPQLALAEPRSGPTPKRRSSNATAVSRTDPDAKLRGKPGQRPHLVHLGAVAVDPKARCVVACLGESAAGFEGDVLLPLLERARFACPGLASVGADSGFAAERVWRALAERGLTAYIPPQPQKLPADGQAKTEAQRQALAARERCKSERGIWAHRRRMADAEGVIGELKGRQTAGRARSRGTPLYHLQLVLDCAALNYKRLADHAGEAHSGAAAGPQVASTAETTAGGANPADRRSETAASGGALQPRLAGSAAVWRYSVCLN